MIELTVYLRLVSYFAVILVSILRLKEKTFNKQYVVANVIMALGLVLSLITREAFDFESEFTRMVFVTPASMIWGMTNVYTFFKEFKV